MQAFIERTSRKELIMLNRNRTKKENHNSALQRKMEFRKNEKKNVERIYLWIYARILTFSAIKYLWAARPFESY